MKKTLKELKNNSGVEELPRALITGIAGQDGSYLAELLLSKGYEVHGIIRYVALENPQRLKNIDNILSRVSLHTTPLDNPFAVLKVLQKVKPDEIYHLAASSFVNYNFENEFSVFNNNVVCTYNLINAIKDILGGCKLYYAGSSEMFGAPPVEPQDENTPFNPRSVYGISKLAGYHFLKNYRERYGLFVCTGLLYNHESPRRGFEFVTRKIALAAARIKLGLQKMLVLGNLDAFRDWGYAPEYVEAMWHMLQAKEPGDYVVGTGEVHSVRYVVQKAFEFVGLNYQEYVESDPRFYREGDAILLRANNQKAYNQLGWKPRKKLDSIICEMVQCDLENLKNNQMG